MTLDNLRQIEQDRKARGVSVSADAAQPVRTDSDVVDMFCALTGAVRSDSGRTCKDCGRQFRPTMGERYCDECMPKHAEGW